MQPSTIALLCAMSATTLLLWLIYLKLCERAADAEFDAQAGKLFRSMPANSKPKTFTFQDIYAERGRDECGQ